MAATEISQAGGHQNLAVTKFPWRSPKLTAATRNYGGHRNLSSGRPPKLSGHQIPVALTKRMAPIEISMVLSKFIGLTKSRAPTKAPQRSPDKTDIAR